MSHTPGPWFAVVKTIRVWPWLPDYPANANLIAAAPELLEALEELTIKMSYMEADSARKLSTNWPTDALDRARAAIRKARGSDEI